MLAAMSSAPSTSDVSQLTPYLYTAEEQIAPTHRVCANLRLRTQDCVQRARRAQTHKTRKGRCEYRRTYLNLT